MPNPENYVQQLADYIKNNLAKGYTLDSLRFSLISQGYSRISVENAIQVANRQLAVSAPPMKEKPQIIYKLEPEVYKKSFWQKIKDFFN